MNIYIFGWFSPKFLRLVRHLQIHRNKVRYSLLTFGFLLLSCFQDRPIPKNSTMESYILAEILENNKPTPKAEIPRTEATVFANRDWQDTGINLMAENKFILKAEGTWYMTLSTPVTAEGLNYSPALFGIDYRLDKGFNHGQLLCRIASGSQTLFSVGEHSANSTGRVLCRINDTDLLNNSGSLKISIF
jgi:hypothetical protein